MNISSINLPTLKVIKSPVTALRFSEQIQTMLQWAKQRESRSVCVANVHMLMEAYWNQPFGKILKDADMVTPDGMPLVWMMRQRGLSTQDRVAGMDILQSLCQEASAQDVSVLFLGSYSAILDRIGERLEQDFPKLKVAGLEPLPFRPLTETEDEALIEKINASGAGIVFVSLGCPKQERFIAEHKDKINAVMIGVGAVFPLYAGLHKRAPLWVRESGLEWLYRLLQEPKRLWSRYGQTIPPFLWLATKQLSDEGKLPLVSSSETESAVFPIPHGTRPIGQILTEAGLLSQKQVNLILQEQQKNGHLKFGDIQAEQGWLHPETVDFFAEHAQGLLSQNQKKPLGYYLKSAKLLNEKQIDMILAKQMSTGSRFGEIAVGQGWVKQQTLDVILEYLHLEQPLPLCA